MSAIVDWAVVLLAVGGALVWLVRRFRSVGAGACSSGCGKCEEARANAGKPASAGAAPLSFDRPPGLRPLARPSASARQGRPDGPPASRDPRDAR